MLRSVDLDVATPICKQYGANKLVLRVNGWDTTEFVTELNDVVSAYFVNAPSALRKSTFKSMHQALRSICTWKSINALQYLYYNGKTVKEIRDDPQQRFWYNPCLKTIAKKKKKKKEYPERFLSFVQLPTSSMPPAKPPKTIAKNKERFLSKVNRIQEAQAIETNGTPKQILDAANDEMEMQNSGSLCAQADALLVALGI